MEPGDLAIRNLTYHHFVEHGRAPTSSEIAALVGVDPGEIRTTWRRLHDTHALVVDAATGEIRMANPFSAVPTPFRVHVGERWWYANCAWDAIGICAALHSDGRIDTACPDCGDPLACEIRDRQPDNTTLVFHCLVPAAAWWHDIVFTCSTMNLFRSEEHVTRWLNGRRPGVTIPVTQLADLAHAWWGDRLDTNWQPHTRDENQTILTTIGLTNDFWRLP